MTRSQLLTQVAIAIALSGLAGCGTQDAGPETFPVTGRVTLGGQPVEGAVVQFVPGAPEPGGGGGQTLTTADGSFDLYLELEMGQSRKRGLPAGEYRVAVTKLQIPEKFTHMAGAPKNLLPPKYGALETTPLTATVKADGENQFELPLE